MVLYHRGETTAARDALSQSQSAVDALCQRRADGTIIGSSLLTPSGRLKGDVVNAEVLRREASGLIDGQE